MGYFTISYIVFMFIIMDTHFTRHGISTGHEEASASVLEIKLRQKMFIFRHNFIEGEKRFR